jgi:hypothetical protein
MKQLRTIRTGTKHKYYRVIQDCANAGTFEIHAMRDKHKCAAVLFQAMSEAECINRSNNTATWISGPITDAVLNKIFKAYETINRKHRASELLRKSNINPKQIIAKQYTPPAPAPLPIEKAHVDTNIADNTIDVGYRYAFITGMLMGVLITSVIAYLW